MQGQRVVLATGNAGKLREFSELLGATGLVLVRQSDFGIAPPPETGSTFLENALLKARNAARLTGLPAIADDSGIEVDALDGRPGVYSARYAGEDASDEAESRQAAAGTRGLPRGEAHARVIAASSFIWSMPTIPRRWSAKASGKASSPTAPRGTGGFGYDPSSFPRGDTRTAAEMPAGRTNERSHRGQAAARLPRAVRAHGRADENAAAGVVRAFSLVRAEVPVLRLQLAHAAGRIARAALHRGAAARSRRAGCRKSTGRPLTSIFLGAARPACFRRRPSGGSSTHARAQLGFAGGHRNHARGQPGHHRARPVRRIPRRRRDARVTGCAEFRRAAAETAGPHPFRRRNAPRRGRAARRGPRQLQPRPDVRPAGANGR